jgi:hypothetical protein
MEIREITSIPLNEYEVRSTIAATIIIDRKSMDTGI